MLKVRLGFFFFKPKTGYEWRISDWSSDVCSSDLAGLGEPVEPRHPGRRVVDHQLHAGNQPLADRHPGDVVAERRQAEQHRRMVVTPVTHQVAAVGEQRVVGMHHPLGPTGGAAGEGEVRSEEHTSELQSLMRTSYAVF